MQTVATQPEARELDALLVRRTLAGETSAFNDLVDRHAAMVHRIVLRMTGSADVAADLGQQAFIMAFESVSRLKEHASFRSWLASIAVNCCRDWLKDLRRQTGQIDENAVIESSPYAARLAGPHECAELSELRRHLERALSLLRPIYREAVILKDIEGFSFEEMEKIIGLEQASIKQRVARARIALRETLLSWGVR
jgi:RNA polymerase sigma-70 factor (ECF subfamily)